ncbi:MAG: DUF1570 domain-containing protein [Fuerstiella sp.]|nr:DUF1570 domain-containing protein [Fuerstiella sp.]MDG2129512.1 DUF1570 domain-containing protein [Fuerstiella sp.]
MHRRLTHLMKYLCCLSATAVPAQDLMQTVTLAPSADGGEVMPLTGRVLAEVPNGSLLLEERSGQLHNLTPKQFTARAARLDAFSYLPPDEMATLLLQQTGGGTAIHQTEHFVICSDASELYTAFCGRLLEKVVVEYLKFFEDSDIQLKKITAKLPVLIFRDTARFQEFAQRQHPDTDFSDVPGYYSVRDNQMLITAISGDREFRTNSDVVRELKKKPRQVETIVHEAVHQLTFNTGLQVRFADNPMWLSEGLAVFFERASGRSSTIWSRPGEVSRIHLPGFQAATSRNRLRLPLSQLLESDQVFQSPDQLADAYAEGWGLTFFLIRSDRAAFDRLLSHLQNRKPLQPVGTTTRLAEFETATGRSLEDFERYFLRYMSRIRTRP